jgi:hypothetical protein
MTRVRRAEMCVAHLASVGAVAALLCGLALLLAELARRFVAV